MICHIRDPMPRFVTFGRVLAVDGFSSCWTPFAFMTGCVSLDAYGLNGEPGPTIHLHIASHDSGIVMGDLEMSREDEKSEIAVQLLLYNCNQRP